MSNNKNSTQYGYLAGLGAVCYASEGIVSSLYTQLYRGILGSTPLPKEALIFFEVHIDEDESHAAKLAAVIEPHITVSNQDINLKVQLAIKEAMEARFIFFNGIERQICEEDRKAVFLVPPALC